MIPIPGYAARPMSALAVENEAIKILRQFDPNALSRAQFINIESVMDQVFFNTGYSLQLVDENDCRLKRREGVTIFESKTVLIRKSTYDKLGNNDGRSRFTIAHECGHIIMHAKQWLNNLSIAARTVDVSKLKPFESPEWQADVFAAALLMPEPTFWPEYCILMKEQDGMFPEFEVHALANTYKMSCVAVEKRIAALLKKKGLPM